MKKWIPVLVCTAFLMTGCGSQVPVIGETVTELIEAVNEDLNGITGLVTGGPEALIGMLTGGQEEEAETEKPADEEQTEQSGEKEEKEKDPTVSAEGSSSAAFSEEIQDSVSPEDSISSEDSPARNEDPNYMNVRTRYRNGNTLKKLGMFSLEGENQDLKYNSIMLFRKGTTENTVWLVGPDGEKALDYELDPKRCEYLGDGYYAVAKAVSEDDRRSDNGDIDRNTVGLIRMDGTEVRQILPCEYAKFEFFKADFMLDSGIPWRFMKVYTVEAPTDDRKDYLVFFTDRMFSIIPQEGDFIYSGHWELFDLAGEGFVPGIVSESSGNLDYNTVGNGIIVKKDGMKSLIDAYGKELLPPQNYLETGIGVVVVHEKDEDIVYDDLGNEMFRSPVSEGKIRASHLSESGYLRRGDQILDRDGTVLFTEESSWGDFREEKDGVFLYGDGKTAVSSGGTVLGEAPEGSRWLRARGVGFFATVPLGLSDSGERKTTWILSRGGIIGEDLKGRDAITFDFKDDAGNHYVFDKGTYSCAAGVQERMLDIGLLASADSSGGWGLYDLFSGNELLGHHYGLITKTGHMIVAVDFNGLVETFELLGPGPAREKTP